MKFFGCGCGEREGEDRWKSWGLKEMFFMWKLSRKLRLNLKLIRNEYKMRWWKNLCDLNIIEMKIWWRWWWVFCWREFIWVFWFFVFIIIFDVYGFKECYIYSEEEFLKGFFVIGFFLMYFFNFMGLGFVGKIELFI